MLNAIKKFLGMSTVDISTLISEGAKVIDVRTPSEFSSGHFKGSINIPLDVISSKLNTLDKEKTYVLCCRSGMRSASATSILKQAGFERVYNGGGWTNLK